MIFFPLDCETPYVEYIGTIFHHAENFQVRDSTPAQHYGVCQQVYTKAIAELKARQFDLAFFHLVRCISIIEKTNLRKQISDSKQLMRRCLEALERLKENELVQHHSFLLKKVRDREEERMRIVQQQLAVDESDTELPEERHRRRQQELLMNENTVVDDALNKLRGVQIHSPSLQLPTAVEPYWNDTRDERFGVSSDHIVFPRKIPNTSPNAYKIWTFNNASSHKSFSRRGMVNLGNTCFLNSVTQMLYVTPLGNYFLCDDYTKDIVGAAEGELRLVNSLSYVLRELNRTSFVSPVSPSPFKDAVGEYNKTFLGYSQQDANEFLRVLLDGVHNGLNDRKNMANGILDVDTSKASDLEIAKQQWSVYKQQNNSVVVDRCVFQERSSLVCPRCHQISRSFSPLLGLEVPIPSSTGSVSIEDCLRAYCKEEILDSDSLYLCPSCKNRVNASKQLLVYSLPTILFITIKRFRNYGDFSNKLSDSVVFQKQLNMSPFMCSPVPNTVYNLVAVVNHQGNIHGGHYTADCLGSDGVWFSFSDERVFESQEPDYKLAYILCYVRQT